MKSVKSVKNITYKNAESITMSDFRYRRHIQLLKCAHQMLFFYFVCCSVAIWKRVTIIINNLLDARTNNNDRQNKSDRNTIVCCFKINKKNFFFLQYLYYYIEWNSRRNVSSTQSEIEFGVFLLFLSHITLGTFNWRAKYLFICYCWCFEYFKGKKMLWMNRILGLKMLNCG